ncbi:MAG: YVTN family beta-propeller protein [Candidatus Nitrosomirales archaeon]|jgi:YVTN family beta-propeller protein
MNSLLLILGFLIILTNMVNLESAVAFQPEFRVIRTSNPDLSYIPHQAAVNVKSNTLYVGNMDSSITVIDIASEEIVDRIDLDDKDFFIPEDNQLRVAVNPNTNTIYAVSHVSSFVYVIDGSTNTVIDRVSLGEHSPSHSIAVDPDANEIFISTDGGNFVAFLDGSTNKIVEKLYIGERTLVSGDVGLNFPAQLAVNPVTHLLYATNFPAKLVNVIDGSTHKIASNITTNINPAAVAVNTDTNTIFVAGHQSLLVIDSSTNEIISELTVGVENNDRIYLNSKTNRLYTAAHSGPLVVIDTSTNSVLRSMPLDTTNRGIVVNPNNNMIYLASPEWGGIVVLNATDIEKEIKPKPFSISTRFEGEAYTITGTTNNTSVSAFSVNPERSSIEIKVDGKKGDIELTLPTDLISGIQSVRIEKWGDSYFEEVASSPTSTTIQFSVPPNGGSIEIVGTKVVPEFPIGVMVPAIAIAFMLGIMRLWNVRLRW